MKPNSENNGKNFELIELLPKNFAAKKVLNERAKLLAKPLKARELNKQGISYVCFKLGDNEQYGIPYNYIKEIIMYTPPTLVPFTTKSIAGIINRHGVLLAVLDLEQYFNIKENTKKTYSNYIVITHQGVTIALLVQTIIGQDVFNLPSLTPALQFEGTIKPEYIQGLHKSTIAIINVETLIKQLQINSMHIKESMS